MPRAEDISFSLPDGSTGHGRLVLPEVSGPLPGVLVLHEIMGLNDDMERIAGRFADSGYAALAVNFFGSGMRALCILRAIAELKHPERAKAGGPLEILAGARAFLAAHERVDEGRIGAVGFCMGGGFALLCGTRSEIGVVGAFYGDVPKKADALRGSPPVIAGFGGRDKIFGPGAERLRAHLAELDVPCELKVYPEAGHSYMSPHDNWLARMGAWGPMRVGYDEAAAEDSWQRMLTFFEEHLAP